MTVWSSSPTTYAQGETTKRWSSNGPLERAGAAQALPRLEHEHRLAGPGQVGGRGQAVVPAADDHRVPGLRA